MVIGLFKKPSANFVDILALTLDLNLVFKLGKCGLFNYKLNYINGKKKI